MHGMVLFQHRIRRNQQTARVCVPYTLPRYRSVTRQTRLARDVARQLLGQLRKVAGNGLGGLLEKGLREFCASSRPDIEASRHMCEETDISATENCTRKVRAAEASKLELREDGISTTLSEVYGEDFRHIERIFPRDICVSLACRFGVSTSWLEICWRVCQSETVHVEGSHPLPLGAHSSKMSCGRPYVAGRRPDAATV